MSKVVAKGAYCEHDISSNLAEEDALKTIKNYMKKIQKE